MPAWRRQQRVQEEQQQCATGVGQYPLAWLSGAVFGRLCSFLRAVIAGAPCRDFLLQVGAVYANLR